MNVRKDATMDNFATTDDDFEALLNASSLGAPHVLAETEPIPADVHHRLSQAAARPARRADEPWMQDKTGSAPAAPSGDLARPASFHDRLEGLWERLERTTVVVLVGAPGSGRSATAVTLLAGLTGDEHAAHRVPVPTWLQRLWQQAGQEYGYVVQDACALRTEQWNRTGYWDFTVRMTLHCTVSPAATQLPLYARDDMADHPFAQTRVQPAQMTDLLTVEEADPACTATLRPDLWPEARQWKVWLLNCCMYDAAQAPARPGTVDGDQAIWRRTRMVGSVSSPVLAPIPPGALHPDTMRRLPGLRNDPPRHRTWPGDGVLFTSSCTAIPQAVCRLTWVDPLSLGHPPALPYPRRGLDGCSFFGLPSFLPLLSGGRRSGPPRDKPVQPAGTAGAVLRMWTENAAEGTAQHALLQMIVHQGEGGKRAELPVRLTYRPTDPYAVETVFYSGEPRGEVVWTFARDLLIGGLEHSAGEGDVTVWSPSEPKAKPGTRRTFIRLSSPEGTAVLSVPRAHLKRYLDKTQSLVAVGMEHQPFGSSLDVLDSEWVDLACPGFSD